jgi:hypothetical protein
MCQNCKKITSNPIALIKNKPAVAIRSHDTQNNNTDNNEANGGSDDSDDNDPVEGIKNSFFKQTNAKTFGICKDAARACNHTDNTCGHNTCNETGCDDSDSGDDDDFGRARSFIQVRDDVTLTIGKTSNLAIYTNDDIELGQEYMLEGTSVICFHVVSVTRDGNNTYADLLARPCNDAVSGKTKLTIHANDKLVPVDKVPEYNSVTGGLPPKFATTIWPTPRVHAPVYTPHPLSRPKPGPLLPIGYPGLPERSRRDNTWPRRGGQSGRHGRGNPRSIGQPNRQTRMAARRARRKERFN